MLSTGTYAFLEHGICTSLIHETFDWKPQPIMSTCVCKKKTKGSSSSISTIWAVLIHLPQVDIHLTKSSREGGGLLHLSVQYLTT